MIGPEGQQDVNPASLDTVLAEFDGRREMLSAFCAKTKTLIEECLEDGQIRYQSIQSRVKSKKKLEDKYAESGKNYNRLDDITDLAGLRIITYYEDEVDVVAGIIRREFDIDDRNSADRRTKDPEKFSYHAINYVCRYSAQRLANVEYKRFAGVCCEIQITSVLRHAWAEIEHDWYDLKDAFPPEIKRRFYRMAALLEVAESEFLELRSKRSAYQRSIAVQIGANVPGIPLDAVSLASFIDQEPLIASIDSRIAAALGIPVGPSGLKDSPNNNVFLKMANRAGLKTTDDLRNALKTHEGSIIEHVQLSQPHIPRASGSPLARGASVFRLSLMLLGRDGETNLSQAILDSGATFPMDAAAVAQLARRVTAKR